MLRKSIFWLHLSAGVLAGLVIFSMSLTGVLLAFEPQIKHWAAASHYVPAAEQHGRLSLDQLMAKLKLAKPGLEPTAISISSDAAAPVTFRAGRRGGADLNPYTGELMEVDTPTLNQAFRSIENAHRWFALEGEGRTIGRQIIDIANLVFLFIVLSGLYLWLPPLWKRGLFKVRVWLRNDYPNSKSRDYHWHHVFGIWMALPLLAVVYSGVVMTYPWAANLLYRAFGAEMPAAPGGPGAGGGFEGGPGGGFGGGRRSAADEVDAATPSSLSLDALLSAALADGNSADWQRLTLTLPRAAAPTLQIEIDQGNGTQAHLRHTLVMDRSNAAIQSVRQFSDTPKALQLRGIARFLHTGEVLGLWGQIVAALASAAALLMVWTGLSLAWRRLIQPLFKRTQS